MLTLLAAPSLAVAQVDVADAMGSVPPPASNATSATTLLDLSGLAPLGPGLALGVHDGKSPDEDDRPRASVLWLSDSPTGLQWAPVAFDFEGDLPNDLESASAVPGTSLVVLAESGDDGSDFQRLFLVDIDVTTEGGPTGTVRGVADWPEPVFNVEGMAVTRVGDAYVLLYAERAEGDPTTRIQLAQMTLDPFGFGEPTGEPFTSPAVLSADDRPVSAMEVSEGGFIHVASAFDSGDDDGPFAASVWLAGAVVERDGEPSLEMIPEPSIVAFIDGYKTESLALLETADGEPALYFGTDDENLGGTLRLLPAQ
jgi:hypothetical protein